MADGDLCGWWFERQGLGEEKTTGITATLEQAGWLHTAGGQGPYLSLRVRAGADRAMVDAVVASGEIVEVPSVRGCTMLVPAADAALALMAARAPHDERMETVRKKCGLTERELGKLCDAVLRLFDVELESEDLVARLGPKLVRSLGEAGKKLGYATTLPIALAELQVRGEIRRLSANGRLDTSRYRYRRSTPGLLLGKRPSEIESQRELARRFFRWAGPAKRDELAFWLGLSARRAQEIIEMLALTAVGDRWVTPADASSFAKMRGTHGVRLVPFRDNLFAFRRGLSPFVESDIELLDWSKGTVKATQAASLHQHAIIDGGRLIGVWEWDPEKGRVEWGTFQDAAPSERRAIEASVEELTAFVVADLGDVKFYSVDNAGNRNSRLDFVRALPCHASSAAHRD